jgi:hypothetical protein
MCINFACKMCRIYVVEEAWRNAEGASYSEALRPMTDAGLESKCSAWLTARGITAIFDSQRMC